MINKDESVEITWKNGETTLLPNLWLRDNCACDVCRNTQTTEKLFQLAQVDVNLMPETVDLIEDELHLLWPDGHRSVYEGSVIRTLTIPQTTHLRLWSSEFRPQQFDYGKFKHNDSIAVDAIEDFLITGAILLTNAPTTESLEYLTPMLGPLRETVFGRIHNVVVDSTGYNVASTNLELPPHTDLSSYSWPPSAQALHMLVNETEHGESIIVDGFAVATQFRNDHPNWFDRLCCTPVPFRIFDANNETFATQPIIQLDTGGQIAGVRYSNQTMQPMNIWHEPDSQSSIEHTMSFQPVLPVIRQKQFFGWKEDKFYSWRDIVCYTLVKHFRQMQIVIYRMLTLNTITFETT